jgi:ABC-2 type transport system permease protein
MPIFDQGYQHWKGTSSSHGWRWLAISRQGFRSQLKGRYVKLVLFMAWIPALALVSALAAWGLFEQGVLGAEVLSTLRMQGITDNPQDFRQAMWTIAYSIFFRIELGFILMLVTLAGPNLISLDLRHNALPLYLSRPLTRLDYFFGKLGVIAGLVAAVAVLPAAGAYVLGVCFSLNLTVVRDTWRLLPASILYGLVIVVSAGTLMLALSSMSRRSIYVGLTWIGLFLIGLIVAGVLGGIHAENVQRSRMYKLMEFQRSQNQRANQPRTEREQEIPPVLKESDSGQSFDDVEFSGGPMPQVMPMEADSPQARQRALMKFQQTLQAEESQGLRSDWRPLFSYWANLERIGAAILDTDAAWVRIGRAYESQQAQLNAMSGMSRRGPPTRFNPPPSTGERDLAEFWVPQYPWTWSAGVLVGLFVLSLCILSTRVKSLDRLK